jgi:outer membrane lipoprotein-sorting protein
MKKSAFPYKLMAKGPVTAPAGNRPSVKRRRVPVYPLLICLLLLLQPISSGAASSPRAVLEDLYHRQGLGEGSFLLEIEAVSSDGTQQDRARIKVYLDKSDSQLVTFEEPERMKDDCYLVVGYNTWILQAGMRRPLRISAQQKLFGEAGIAETVGLDYLNDYRIEESAETETEYQLHLVALDRRTAYQRATIWVGKEDGNIQRVRLLAINGQPLKELIYSNYRSINGHEVGEIIVKNLLMEKNQQTVLKFLNIIEKQIPPAAFQPMMMSKARQIIMTGSQE